MFRDSQQIVDRLDFAKADIAMSVDTITEFKRTKACAKEPETVSWIEDCLRPGDIFYDIGANVGAYSLLASAASAGRCKVYSFEPSFSTYAALCKNVALNSFATKVLPLNVALADETSLGTLQFSDVRAGAASHNLVMDANRCCKTSRYTHSVLCYRLDDLVKQFQLDPPNLIKIDVDGAEWSVVRGATSTLSSTALRSLLIEIDDEGESAHHIVNALEGAGLSCRSRHARRRSATLANYIFERDAR